MDIVTLAAARKGGGSGGDVTRQYVDEHLALKADKSETQQYPIADSTTGINPTITDSADGYVQGLTVYGRSRVSKNLFDKNAVTPNSMLNANDGTTVPNALWCASAYTSVTSNRYTYSINAASVTTNIITFCFYDASKKYLSSSQITYQGEPITVNVPNNAIYIRYEVKNDYVDIAQFELGSTATPYEPYGAIISIGDSGSIAITTANSDSSESSTATVTTGLPLCGIPVNSGETYTDGDGVKWLADTESVEGIVKRCYKVTFDGSEDERWTASSALAGIFYIEVSNLKKSNDYTQIIMCNKLTTIINERHFGQSSGLAISGYFDENIIYPHTNWIYVGIDDSITTVADLKTYLSSNPVTVVYELATPTTQELTAAEKSALLALRTFDSTTNVTITDDPFVDISYIKNTNNGKAAEQLADNLRVALGWIANVPEMHRNILRGKYLGSAVTAAQLAAIADGSFDDLYIGDYWTIPTTIGGVTTSIKYRIADIDYLLGTGEYPDHILDKHHLVIVPDTALDTAVMGSNNYWTSPLRTTNIAAIKTALDVIFPDLILPFYLQPTVTDPTYLQCYVEVMSAYMVYGHQGLYIDDDRSPIDKTQLALFALAPKAITVPDTSYWLNTRLSDTTRMQAVTKAGEMWRGTVASSQYGIRPFFLLGDAT